MTKADRRSNVAETASEGTKKKASASKTPVIEIPATLSVKQLADLLRVNAVDVIKRLMRNGIMANINQAIEYESAAAVVADFGYEVRLKAKAGGRSASLISEIKKRIDISKAKVAVLGLTFKKDCDDKRDSLSFKLLKILKNEFVKYETHDPFIDDKDIKDLFVFRCS